MPSVEQSLDKHLYPLIHLRAWGRACRGQEEGQKALHSTAYTLVGKIYDCSPAVNVINVCPKCHITVLEGKGEARTVDWGDRGGSLRVRGLAFHVGWLPGLAVAHLSAGLAQPA